MAEDSKRDDKTDMSTEGTNFIAIESFYRLSYARELCLKADDVFVAIDHNPITWDIDKFDNKYTGWVDLGISVRNDLNTSEITKTRGLIKRRQTIIK